jgi:adenosylcobinamide-GDP ribazoletransferase
MSKNMQEFTSNLLSRGKEQYKEQYKELVSAVRFLTILPLPDGRQPTADETVAPPFIMGSGYFPVVGLLLALLLWLLTFIFGAFVPALALAALVVVALVVLTGGLHLDGLMDSCDGLFGGTTRERKLEIMRDSRVGSFGVLGGACLLLLKFAFLASLGAHFLPASLLMALPSARWGMILAVRVFPSARAAGLGASFRSTAARNRLLLAGITS